MNGKFRIKRVLAGLLCLLLLVGFLPAEQFGSWLGNLIPKTEAAVDYIDYAEQNIKSQITFNGLYILRSNYDNQLVLTLDDSSNYTGESVKFVWKKLGENGTDIRKQIFLFRQTHGEVSGSFENQYNIYIRPLYEVYRNSINSGQYSNVWMTSGWAPYMDPVEYGNAATAGGQPESNPDKFKFGINIYNASYDYNGHPCFIAGIHDQQRKSSSYIYLSNRNGSGSCYTTVDAEQAKIIFQPVSYNIPDNKVVNIYCQLSSNSINYLQFTSTAASTLNTTTAQKTNWSLQWTLVRAGSGYYAIVNNQHERYLAVNGTVATLGNTAAELPSSGDLQGTTWRKPQDAELWQIVPYQHNMYGYTATTYLLVNKATGRLLLKSSGDNNNVTTGSFYNTNIDNSLWQIRYSENETINNWQTHTNRYVQTNFDGRSSIQYPINITSNGVANHQYHTLQLGYASTPSGYFVPNDVGASTANLESKLAIQSGYVFDTSLQTSGTATRRNQLSSISFDATSGIIKNSTALYLVRDKSGNPPASFMINESYNYSAKIAFQFKYASGMFMRIYGAADTVVVRIYESDSSTLLSQTNAVAFDTAQNVSFPTSLTVGKTYTMVIDKVGYNTVNSHFGIFTNVQPLVVQDELDEHDKTKLFDTTASVYLGDTPLNLNAVVPIGERLEYRFKVTNRSVYNMFTRYFQSLFVGMGTAEKGEQNLDGFGFGPAYGYNGGSATDSTGGELTIDELKFVIRNANNETVDTIQGLNSDGVNFLLTYVPDGNGGRSYGLPTGWSIEVQGIYYKPSQADYDYARKLVYFSSQVKFHLPGNDQPFTKISENTAVHFTNEPFFVQWAGQELTVGKDTLMQMITAAGKHKYEINLGLSKDTITSVDLCDYNGSAWSSEFVSTSGTMLKLNYKKPGVNQIILKIYYMPNNSSEPTFAMIPTQVFVYDVSDDDVIVLDYGLPVEIPVDRYTTDKDFHQPYNKLEIGTPFATTIKIHLITATKPTYDGTFLSATESNQTTYGTIAVDDANKITYTPTAFLDGPDYIYVVFQLVRDTKLGVEVADVLLMYKTITILPGNVVYYEDTIGSVTYPDGFKLEQLGSISGVSGTQKLPTGSGNYGYDDGSYADSKDVTLSGLSYQKVPVHDKQVELNFTFKGTGFELISRVNAKDSATIIVKVRPKGGSESDWTWYPVITQFDPNKNGKTEVYQVPVFRLNNDAYGTYEVQVVGLPDQTFDESGKVLTTTDCYIYIDGIRVYNPLGYDDPLTENYGNEQGAKFDNIRDLILKSQGLVTKSEDGKLSGFATGSYYYVPDDTYGGKITAAMGGINELGAIGANNEILIRKSAGDNMIVLRVKDNGGGLLQVGIHDIHDAMFDGADPKSAKNDPTTVHIRTTSGWTALASGIYHGTEQYYNIDLAQCPTDGTYKIVMLKVESGFASFTNVKHKNVDFGTIGEKALDIFVQPGFYINQSGDMCKIDENGNEEIVEPGVMTNLSLLNSLLQDETM